MRFYWLLIFIVISMMFVACSKNSSSTEKTICHYLVGSDGQAVQGKKFGCNEVLVRISRTVSNSDNEMEEALNDLLSAKDTDELKNYVKGPQLLLFKVNIANGIADVYLKGDFRIDGLCDIYRIDEQIHETVNQFSSLKKINIYINNQTLASYLNVAKAGFK